MTYKNIDPSRFRDLVTGAISDAEMKRFFQERKRPLIMKGVRIQNLPRSHTEALQTISRFSEGAHEILGEWLEKELARDGETRFEGQLCPWFQAVESYHLRLSDDDRRALFRSGLRALYRQDAPEEWIAFLQTGTAEPLRKREAEPDVDPDSESARQVGPQASRPTFDEIQQFVEWLSGTRAANTISSTYLQALAGTCDALRKGSRDLAPHEISNEVWANLSGAWDAKVRAHQSSGTFTTERPGVIPYDDDTPYLDYDVICIASRNPGQGPYFLDVFGFLHDRRSFTLEPSALSAVLPEEGRVILHANSGLPLPKPGIAEAYRVELYKAHGPIKVRAIRRGAKLHPVVYVPHSSAERDDVRQWLLERAVAYAGRDAVYVLSDGRSIRAADDAPALLSAAHFDWQFESWRSLSGLELGRSTYVPGPLPTPDETYECAPLSVIARRFLRSLSEKRDIGVSKAQLRAIAKQLDSTEVALNTQHRERLRHGLESLAETDPSFEEIVSEVLKSPAVQASIQAERDRVVSEADSEIAKRRKLLDNLRKDTQAQEERLNRVRAQTDERTREIRAAVRKAFEQARDKEAQTLGQVALWQELLVPQQRAAPSAPYDHAAVNQPVTSLTTAVAERSGESVSAVLRSARMSESLAGAYERIIQATIQSGAPIVLRGVGNRHLASRLARALASHSVSVVDVNVGLIAREPIQDALRGSGADVVLLQGANLSDICAYAPSLLDDIVNRICSVPSGSSAPIMVLSEASGAAALPFPTEITLLSAKVDLDLSEEVVTKRPKIGSTVPGLQAKLLARVMGSLEGEPEMIQAVAENVILGGSQVC